MQQIGEIQKALRPAQRRRLIGAERASQEQTVAIKRGLFLIRYATAEDEAYPPKIKVTPDPASNKDIRFLLHPDHSDPMLWQPDACLVVRATAPGTLSVQVTPMQEGGSTAATVRIEPVKSGRGVGYHEETSCYVARFRRLSCSRSCQRKGRRISERWRMDRRPNGAVTY